MAIKQTPIITKDDFEQAIVTHRLSVSEVARETGIPRHVVSHFRNYADGLKPEQAAKLRDYFVSIGVEFADEDEPATPEAATSIDSLSPQLGVGIRVERHFPISSAIPDEVVRNAMGIMEDNDARLVALLKSKIEREEGFFREGDLTDETKAALQETFALLAGNYIVFRMLRGWSALKLQPATDKPETVRDMVLQTFMQQFVKAGLVDATPHPKATEVESEEVAA